MTMEDQEGELDVLQILKDEDEDQHQRKQSNDERRPGSTEARVLLARIWLRFRRHVRQRWTVRAQFFLRTALQLRTPVNDNPPMGSVIGPKVVVSLVITTDAPGLDPPSRRRTRSA